MKQNVGELFLLCLLFCVNKDTEKSVSDLIQDKVHLMIFKKSSLSNLKIFTVLNKRL